MVLIVLLIDLPYLLALDSQRRICSSDIVRRLFIPSSLVFVITVIKLIHEDYFYLIFEELLLVSRNLLDS